MRLDKYLCENHIGSRSEIKAFVKKGLITVNGEAVSDSGMKIDETCDLICYQNKPVRNEGNHSHIYAINKPSGYVCSKDESEGKTVFELLPDAIKDRYSCIGRLDKETTGLLLFTDDGDLLHRLISPKKHVDKTYFVTCEKEVTDEDLKNLSEGVPLGDGEISLPATCIRYENESNIILLTIHEGKFHQVKRMLKATCNKVTALSRISFGKLTLKSLSLKEGEGRYLTEEESELLNSVSERME